MSKLTSYPIYMAPTAVFMATLQKQKDLSLTITNMEFIEDSGNRFTAKFTVQVAGKKLKQDVAITRPFPSLAAIEDYVLNALKPEGQFA